MNESYERTYGTKPKENSSPLEKNDHPELDNSTLVSPDKIVLFPIPHWLFSVVRYSWSI